MTISGNETVPITINWTYLLLKAIQQTVGTQKPQARLLCQDDDGGWTTVIRCNDSFLDYLKPYAELLEAAEAGLHTEYPVIPVEFRHGKVEFSIQGAQMDYPHLRDRHHIQQAALRASLSPPPF